MKHILLKSLLSEINKAEGFVPLPESEANEILKKHCSEVLELYASGKPKLYRGDYFLGNKHKFGAMDPRNSDRISRNTNNVTTALIAQSDAWERVGIPLRNKSIVMSCGEVPADGYGPLHEVYPVNGAKIAWGKGVDHWDCYETGLKKIFGDSYTAPKNVDDMNFMIHQSIKILLGVRISGDASDIVQRLEELDDYVKSMHLGYLRGRFKNTGVNFNDFERIMNFGGFVKTAQIYIDPELNGIEAHNITSGLWPSPGREVWTDAPCYFLRVEN